MDVVYYGKSKDEETIREIRSKKLPLVIGGEGSVATAVKKKLNRNGITDVYCVSIKMDEKIQGGDRDYRENSLQGIYFSVRIS